jgi:hypothetical protein
MDTKKYFDDPQTIVTSTDIESLAKEVESYNYMEAYVEEKEKFTPRIDFTSASNFAFFGSAEQYYDDAIKRIHQTYPYDGSLYERTAWILSSSYLDNYIFEKEYPRTNGFVRLTARDNATPYDGASSNSYFSSSTPEYILFRGGPHPSTRSKGKDVTDTAGTYKSGYSNVFDQSQNRESNLKIDGGDGNTVEFWMKKTAITSGKREVIFDTYTANATEAQDGYGRMAIEILGTTPEFQVTYIGGNDGFQTASIGQGITSNFSDDKWHHYAFTFANSGSNLQAKLYVDGLCNDVILGATTNLIREQSSATIDYVSGGMYATIGALATSPRGNSTPKLGWAPLSASLDEFRFWKTKRDAQQIGRHWFTQVGGGTNTDDANTHLGVYYKFNEGITSNSSLDSTILDYSGRINNGSWTGYTSGHRSTGSAIVLSNLTTASFEFKDPILYSSHPDVHGYYTSSLEKGKYHDLSNNSSIYRSLPAWIIDEDDENGKVLKKLTQIMASYFDTLQLQIQELPSLQNVSYPSGSQKAYPFMRQALESKGFVTSEIFADASILEQFLNQTDKELFNEKLYNIKNQIYQNIYNSLSHINKIKGTDKSFRNLIRCFGIDDEILKLNLYGNQVDYLLEDNYSSTTVKKNCVNFNHLDRSGGSIYQVSSSANVNSISFISGATGNNNKDYAIPFTTEAEVIFPKKGRLKDKRYHGYTTLSASLFGMHSARQTIYEEVPSNEVDYNDFAPPTQDTANFEVYACRKTLQENTIYSNGYTNKDVFFRLTGSSNGIAIELTSSVFADVYNDAKWNFAVRVRPEKRPLANYISGTLSQMDEKMEAVDDPLAYVVEFYGVNTDVDVVSNEFLLTGTLSTAQGRSFLFSSKRVYAGAHRTNFTGSVLTRTDVKFSSLRCWLDYLDNKTIQAHSRDPRNIGRLNPYQNAYLFEAIPHDGERENARPYVPQMETLVLNWDFTGLTGSGGSNSDAYYGNSSKNASFVVADMSSGSHAITSSYGWVSEISHLQHTGKGDFFLPSKKDVISKEYIYSARQNLPENLYSSDTINIADTDDVVFTRQTVPITHFFAIEKSMYQTISEEILKFFATVVDFNNLIGEPVERYRQDYKAIAKLRQLFFERKVEDTEDVINPDLEKYIDYYRWIDQSISKMIQQIIPASARFSENIRNMVESHVLERNKYWSKLPIVEEKNKYSKEVLESTINPSAPGTSGRIAFNIAPFKRETTAIASPDLQEQLKTISPARMSIRLSDRTRATENAGRNTTVWTRAARDEPAISSGDSDIDGDRKKIFDVIIKTRQRANRTPYKMWAHATRPLHGGVNVVENKKLDLFRNLILDVSGTERLGLEITTGSVQENDIVREYREVFFPESKKREFLTTSRLKSRANTTYTKREAPFTIISSSVTTGYNASIITNFSAGVDFVHLHQDVYGPHYETPMQGPFTEKWVGGYPYRHVWSQFSGSAKVGSSLDTRANRVEGWSLDFKEDTNGKYATITSPISNSVQYPRAMIWTGPKRPVNITNIRMTTGSGGHTDPKHTTRIGNYRYDYNIISTTGRKVNNRYFVKNKGINIDWRDDQKPDSDTLAVQGVATFTAINRSITGSNKFVFVNRFNAPGGPETMCEAFLDLESGEYSLYNCLNYRNLSVRLPLRKWLTNHSNQFGFWSDTQYSASWQTAIDSGFKAAGSYNGTKTNVNSTGYAGTNTLGQPMVSFHNVNRNSRRRIELKGASSHTTMTGTVHDNYWVQHPIPRTDLQYSWITASLINDYSGPALYHYERKTTDDVGRRKANVSTDITFLTSSLTGAAATANESAILVDFAGINTLIYDPINATSNTLSAPSGDYRNTSVASIVQPNDLNSLILHRQGPYGWPSWKQVRLDNHPIARYERKNSILSFMFDKTLNRFTESLATSRYKPLVHVFKEGAIKHTYGNNLANFANVEVRDKLSFDIHGGNQAYDYLKDLYLQDIVSLKPELISLYYGEMLYPKEINVYLKKVRMRENYVVDFWRSTKAKRTKTNITNSQGQTILKQSIWPLDARTDFATAIARGKDDSAGNDGAGELQNNYTIYHGAHGPSSDAHPKIIPAACYARPISASAADGDILYGDTLWESGSPFYDSYDDYSDEIRKVGQNYSIVSEFRISEHMAYYMDDKNGDFFADRESFLDCTGSSYADSTVDNFFKTYSHTDFLKYFSVINKDHEGVFDQHKVTFICNGIMKLLPYKGFYPADRTLQLATLFSQSYGSTEFGTDSYSDNAKRRISLAPFFAPGVLYNSIKSGIAVDYPVYTSQPGSVTEAYSIGTKGNAASSDVYRLSASFDYRLPFDALVRPESYIGNGTSLTEAEPDLTGRHSGSSTTHDATSSVTMDLVKSDLYKYAMHNFLATSIDVFLKNGEISTIVSSKNGDSYIVDPNMNTYEMKIYLSDHPDVSATNTRTFSMYNRQSAFGPTCNAPDSVGGYAPFTPPYYYNDTNTGNCVRHYSFDATAKPSTADKYGTFGSYEYTLDEILSNCTITDSRSVANSQSGTGSSDGNNYVQDINMMNITASVSIFQSSDAHFVIQPKFETPMFNFTNVTKTSPASGDASTKGMWHQKGVYETDNSKGVFLGALDVDGAASLADLLGVNKGLKKIGILPDDNEKSIKEAIVAIPVIKKLNKRTNRVETRFVNVNKNTVKRALSSILSGTPPVNVPNSVYDMVKAMRHYVIPPKFDFLTHLKKFGSKRFRPFAMYFFEFEHEFSQEDLANIWQNLPPAIGSSFKKEQVSVCHSTVLGSGELLTIKELKNPDLHWMVFKVKQKAKWNYFDKVIDLAGQLPPRPDAGAPPASVQLGREAEAPLESTRAGGNPHHGTTSTRSIAGETSDANMPAISAGPMEIPSHAIPQISHIQQLSSGRRTNIEDIVQYARQESDVASGYGLDYSYNWPYDFCSLVELIKLDTEIHLGGQDVVQIHPPTVEGDDQLLGEKKESIMTTGVDVKQIVSDDTREELLTGAGTRQSSLPTVPPKELLTGAGTRQSSLPTVPPTAKAIAGTTETNLGLIGESKTPPGPTMLATVGTTETNLGLIE